MDMTVDDKVFAQDLSQMMSEMTSSVEECALRARSTHSVHHASVEVTSSLVSCLVKCLVKCLLRVVPLVVDAVIGLTLSLISHVVIVVFVVAIFTRIFLCGRYTLFTTRIVTVILHQINVENRSPNNWPNHRQSSFPDRSVLGPSSR